MIKKNLLLTSLFLSVGIFIISAGIFMMSLFATTANAHSEVNKTYPANGAVLPEIPANLDLTFAEKIRMIKVELSHGPHADMELDLGEQTSFTKKVVVPTMDMGAGVYTVNWRGLGTDGHAMTGKFMFEVK